MWIVKFVNNCCFYFSAIKRFLTAGDMYSIFEGEISDFYFIFLPKRRKLLVTFWERTVEKLRNKCNLLFTYALPNHNSLTQHGTAILAFRYAMVLLQGGRGLYHQSLYRKYTYDSPRLNPHILQCAISKMYQENTHKTWNIHTAWKCDLQKQKWGKQKVLAGHTVK